MPDVPRLSAIETDIERLRLAVRQLQQQAEQAQAERDEFIRVLRQHFETCHNQPRNP